MGRTPNQPRPQPEMAEVLPEKAAALVATQDAAALALREADARVRAVAGQLGYQLPADCTDPDLIQRDIAANMRRSVEACLEVGRGLQVLKAACGHGNFLARLDVLGMEDRVARRFMQAAVKFTNRASKPVLEAIGNQTKLFEMLVLDDEQVEELALTGQTGELHLDDVATMSVKELRAAVRDARHLTDGAKADCEAKDKVIARLKTQLRENEQAQPTPDELLEERLHAVREAEATASGWIEGRLRQAIEAVQEYDQSVGGDHGAILSGHIRQLEDATDRLRALFALPRTAGEARSGDDPFAPLTPEEEAEIAQAMPEPGPGDDGTQAWGGPPAPLPPGPWGGPAVGTSRSKKAKG